MLAKENINQSQVIKRNVTLLGNAAPAAAGGLSAAVVDGQMRVTVWIPEQEISVVLSARELSELKYFLNTFFAALIDGTDYPKTFFGDRR